MQMQIMQINEETMGSREIAELCGKEHRHVMRDIENLNDTYVEMSLPKVGQCSYKADNGRQYKEYLLTQDHCIDLITGYSREIRIRINRRWKELEQQVAAPSFQIPQTLGEALQLAANQALQIEQDAPKVAHYNKVVDRHTLLTATQVGQKINMSAVKLNRVLEEIGVYNLAHKRGRAFRQWFIDKELGEMKQTDMGHSQALFSLKGEAWVIERLASESVA